MIYLQLFLSFLKIGAFSFGGGYAAMPLIQNEIVDLNKWLSLSEFTDLITISQMTPGPIAINSATFVGTKVAGICGAIVATIGCILPSCIIVTIIAWFYIKYRRLDSLKTILRTLRPAVVSMIATAGLSILLNAFFKNGIIGINTIQINIIFIFVISLFLLVKKNMSPIKIMILAGFLNVISAFILSI